MKPSLILKFVQENVSKMLSKVSEKEWLEQASDYYELQRKSITAIKDTAGYEEIKKYWYLVYDDAIARFTAVDVNNVWAVAELKADVKRAKMFLEFLENITA
jgi:hypothetical protein